jgi:[ribosomal protein S18]-alanine N-acetyltransferase
MLIRQMTSDDIEKVKQIEDTQYKSPWTSMMFLNEITSNKFAHLFVLEDKDEIIGYSGVWIVSDSATVTKVTISKERQGKGLSNLLMKDLIQRVIDANCAYISLEVRVSNKKAVQLYKKYGFEQVGVRKKYYTDGEDAFAMVKKFGEGTNNE